MTLSQTPWVDGQLMPVFVYGTLQPGEVRWFALDGRVEHPAGEADRVRGRLWDTGLGYPALTLDEPSRWVPGCILRLLPGTAVETWQHLVEIEGGVDSEYRPGIVTTESGLRALAFPYALPPSPDFVAIEAWRHGPVSA